MLQLIGMQDLTGYFLYLLFTATLGTFQFGYHLVCRFGAMFSPH